ARRERDRRQERVDRQWERDHQPRRHPGGRGARLLHTRRNRGRPEERRDSGWHRDWMRIALLTNEYPPHVYGGAGVHVEYLSRELAKLLGVQARCVGEPRRSEQGNPAVRGYPEWEEAKRGTDPRFASAVDAFARSLAM